MAIPKQGAALFTVEVEPPYTVWRVRQQRTKQEQMEELAEVEAFTGEDQLAPGWCLCYWDHRRIRAHPTLQGFETNEALREAATKAGVEVQRGPRGELIPSSAREFEAWVFDHMRETLQKWLPAGDFKTGVLRDLDQAFDVAVEQVQKKVSI